MIRCFLKHTDLNEMKDFLDEVDDDNYSVLIQEFDLVYIVSVKDDGGIGFQLPGEEGDDDYEDDAWDDSDWEDGDEDEEEDEEEEEEDDE